MSRPILEVRGLCHTFREQGKELQVLKEISFSMERGQFVCLVGYSGCGKSTLLRCVAGLLKPQAGEILLGGNRVEEPNAACGMVFQDPRLLPWLRVEENTMLGLSALPREEARVCAEKELAQVGLSEFTQAWPRQLSGGMAQRAALARALAPRPSLLLLDEPLSALDALTRAQLQDDLLRIQREEGVSMLLVTHDIREAIYLGDKVVALSRRPGSICAELNIPREDTGDRTAESFGQWEKKLTELLQTERGEGK